MSWLKLNNIFGIFLLSLLISLPALVPLIQSGFFVTDDGEWMIIRFSAFYQAFADGQFPVRFLHRLNFDFGYPVATFLYPGFMYAGIPLHFLKIGVVETVKVLIGVSILGSTFFTYLWLQKMFHKKFAALIGTFAGLYLPYRLFDIYTRGSVGELFALMWVPFILWMIEQRNLFFLSVGIFLLIISHNTMALLFIPLLFLYALLRRIFSFQRLILHFVLGILLAGFFIVSVITELPLTQFTHININCMIRRIEIE